MLRAACAPANENNRDDCKCQEKPCISSARVKRRLDPPRQLCIEHAALLINIPGVDAISRHTGTEDFVFKVRKNLFETLTFVAQKPK